MPLSEQNEYRLRAGNAVIGIICPSVNHANSLEHYFHSPSSHESVDITLDLSLIPHEEIFEIPDSLFNDKKIQGNFFSICRGIVEGHISPDQTRISLNVKNALTQNMAVRVFEQLLYQAYYNAIKLKGKKSFLLHSSGVIKDGRGFIFCGKSESGKSTAAALSQDYTVTNDEICCVEFTESGVLLHSTPYNGLFTEKKEGAAPLQSLFILKQGPEHRIEEIPPVEAIKIIANEIVPPIGLHEPITGMTYISMLDLARELYNRLPVRRLTFKKDSGFWREIDKYFPNSMRSGNK